MKKLILGIAMLFTGMTAFAKMYNTTAAILMSPLQGSDMNFAEIISILFTAVMFLIGIIGLVYAVEDSKDKQT